jgi:two-component system, sensor histidine kinase and response regulator
MKSTQDQSPTALPSDSLVPLESVLCTEELNRRPTRLRDYETENRALVSLAQALAESPRTILQTLADKILEVFRAGSAGLSLLTKEDGGKRFYWPAIAGMWKPHIGGGTPREFGPCGDVLDRNVPLLFRHFERRYPYLLPVMPPAEECLLVPFYVGGKAVGTIWAIAHDDRRKFDAEDMRQLVSLGTFASSAYQVTAFLDALDQQRETSRQSEEELRLANARLELAVRGSAVGVWDLDLPNGDYDRRRRQYVNVWEQLGYEAGPPVGVESAMDVADPDDRARLEEAVRRYLAGETTEFETEIRLRHKDGSYRTMLSRGAAARDAAGKTLRFVGVLIDITELRRAEGALRASEERFRVVVEAAPNGMVMVGPDGRIVLANVQMKKLFGYEADELIGESVERLVPERFRDGHPALRGRFFAAPEARGMGAGRDLFGCRKDGSEFPVEIGLNPIRMGDGLFVLASVIDVTERKRAEEVLRESEQRWRLILDNAHDAFVAMSADGRIAEWNRHAEITFGWPRAEVVGRVLSETIIPPQFREAHQRGLARFLATGEGPLLNRVLEVPALRRDGREFPAEISIAPVRVGEQCLFAAFIRDVTERKRAEEQLRRAKEAAEAANRAKDEFLANVSHEIRTPMNAILGMTELALDTPLTEDQRQCLRTVKSAADNLLGIINDLLDFAKIEAGKLELNCADFSLRTVVGDTLRALAVRAHSKGLELIYDVQPEVPDALVADAGRLRQVLLNLVGNAIKFTEEGEVVVRVEAAGDPAPEGEVALRFTVRDTGIGIPPDKQEAIFRAFEQEDTSTTRKYGGTGLGLTIASQLVALMGGEIRVDSAPGRGSTFAFTARFGLQPHPTEPAAAPPPVLLRNLPVLIVDDNATNRHILQQWFRAWQMEAEAVGDAASAMDALWHRAANGRPFALVLLDARMPDQDGLTVAALIRERAELAATRLILLASGDRPGNLARLRELRIDAHLLKPVPQEELLETIYRVVSRPPGNGLTTARRAPGQQPAAGAGTAPLLHILVAEDNEFSARLLNQLLGRRGHRVRLASNGPEALALAEEGGFDVLLLDIHMPGLDGFRVVGAIRERERAAGGHLPVIALTARSRKEDRERCLAAGMDDFLTKPVSSAALFAAIDRLVSAPRVSRQFQADAGGCGSLLDPVAVLTACGDDEEGLRGMCQDFQTYAPAQLAEVGDALRDRNAPRLRRAAHKFCPLLFAFSTVAGNVASDLEDHAAQDHLEEARPLVERLEAMTQDLMRLAGGLSLETLRQQARRAGEP